MTDGYSNHFYNKNLQPNANRVRKEMTKAEACLWKYVLRSGKMKGYHFRRQRPVLNYIADFMCKELMLIVEVDGSIHEQEDVIKNDSIRQKKHWKQGLLYYVLRMKKCWRISMRCIIILKVGSGRRLANNRIGFFTSNKNLGV